MAEKNVYIETTPKLFDILSEKFWTNYYKVAPFEDVRMIFFYRMLTYL